MLFTAFYVMVNLVLAPTGIPVVEIVFNRGLRRRTVEAAEGLRATPAHEEQIRHTTFICRGINMATNNYYGFTHGGTQYGNQYQAPASTGYTSAHSQYGGSAATPNPSNQAYAANSNDQYMLSGYTRPAGQVPVPAAQAQQPYYGQTQTYPSPMGATPGSKAAATGAPRTAATSTVYPTYSANTATSSYAGFTPPASATAPSSNKRTTGVSRGGNQGFKRGGNKMKGTRAPPKPQALHYCDVCKISCAGPQTYKEHLDGQKHKKKEAAAKVGTPVLSKGSPPGLRCELCDVTCTGNDAYAAHIRGAKHQKVLKLHTKLGKPIPSDNPTVVTAGAANASPASNSVKAVPLAAVSTAVGTPPASFPKSTPPKINFIGPKTDQAFVAASSTNAGSVSTTAPAPKESASNHDFTTPVPGTITTPGTLIVPSTTTTVSLPQPEVKDASPNAVYLEKEIQPVGQDYIEEVRSDDGKIVSFNCKLCECRFNDPNAKEMHMKGRRHRLQYKKKVNPDLVVDVKPSSRQKKIDESRRNRAAAGAGGNRRSQLPADPFPRGPPVPLLPPGGPRGFGPPGYHAPPNPMFYIPPLIRRNDSPEDLYVMAKHSDIYPQEDELQAIQKIVSNTEKALKFVSDQFAELDAKKVNGIKQEEGSEQQSKTEAELQAHRILKGVMRVGHLAKGLLLRGDRTVELVVLCSEKPTLGMLSRVAETLPGQLQVVAPDDNYEVLRDISSACVVVASTQEPKIEVVVTLTSPLLRGPAPGEATANQVKDDPDVLDKEKCLDALAALRHAKWFQARATSLQSCVILIRIFRDICQRVDEWNSFPCWAIELLTEKVINSVGVPVSPGDGFRLILEAISSGILLPGGISLQDPCEKDSVDALRIMSAQQRNDVTAYGQKALRMMTFRRIHEVLGMEPLQRFNKKGENTRKRRRNESTGGEAEDSEAVADGKKDKKDDIVAVENPAAATENSVS
ncbi:unnamed protein product [Allacma fusca]|uniref:DZF domain-containing protein n=1 Tax=Allacma fusca TaxID=39272 RepID=A0A8J2P7X5_9HEXA|nr:unnamed protein product [Allacma fusca]